MKLWQGNVFTPVCQSFCSQGRWGVCLWSGGGVCPVNAGIHPLHSACWDTLKQVGGMHPTGMHTCFTSVCHSVHIGMYPSMHWDRHPTGRHPPGQTALRVDSPTLTAIAADGTHPTGMRSCFYVIKSVTWVKGKICI